MQYKKLRSIRKAQGLTCEDMAKHLGLATRSAYWKKEQGKIKINLDEAMRISDILKTPINSIFFDSKVS